MSTPLANSISHAHLCTGPLLVSVLTALPPGSSLYLHSLLFSLQGLHCTFTHCCSPSRVFTVPSLTVVLPPGSSLYLHSLLFSLQGLHCTFTHCCSPSRVFTTVVMGLGDHFSPSRGYGITSKYVTDVRMYPSDAACDLHVTRTFSCPNTLLLLYM